MEDIALMVSASLARHGFNTRVDHRRLQWSRWCRCESSLSVVLAPSKPGVFALAEEANSPSTSVLDEKRLLTVYQISESEDLGMALGRLFLPNFPEQTRFANRPCYVRYAIIEDADQRHASCRALREWMVSSTESTTEIPNNLTVHTFAKDQAVDDESETLPLARTGT
jgi:hypothetical protein